MVPWKIELAVSKNQASLRYRTAVIDWCKGRLLGGPGSPSRRIEEIPDDRVSFLLCASLFHGGRAARWRRSLHEVVLTGSGASEHLPRHALHWPQYLLWVSWSPMVSSDRMDGAMVIPGSVVRHLQGRVTPPVGSTQPCHHTTCLACVLPLPPAGSSE